MSCPLCTSHMIVTVAENWKASTYIVQTSRRRPGSEKRHAWREARPCQATTSDLQCSNALDRSVHFFEPLVNPARCWGSLETSTSLDEKVRNTESLECTTIYPKEELFIGSTCRRLGLLICVLRFLWSNQRREGMPVDGSICRLCLSCPFRFIVLTVKSFKGIK